MGSNRRITSTSLSSRIIEYLVKHGQTQADIARMLGVSQGFISLVRSRERGLTLDHLERLSLELSIPLGAFLLAVTEPPPGTPDPKGIRTVLAEAIRKSDALRESLLRAPASTAKQS